MSRAKGPHRKDSSSFLVDLGKGMGENAGVIIQFFPMSLKLSFFLPDAMLPEPGTQLQLLEAEMIPTSEAITIFLNLYVRTCEDLMDRLCLYPIWESWS